MVLFKDHFPAMDKMLTALTTSSMTNKIDQRQGCLQQAYKAHTYTYDGNGKPGRHKDKHPGSFYRFCPDKRKQWKYTAEGKPLTMLLINNGSDSIGYRFTLDSQKNVADEMMYHRGGTQTRILLLRNNRRSIISMMTAPIDRYYKV